MSDRDLGRWLVTAGFVASMLILTTGASLGAPGGEEGSSDLQKTLEARVLWGDAEHQVPMFIPQRLLETTPLDELPIDYVRRDFLESEVEKFQDERWGYRCNSSDDESEQGADEVTFTFEEQLRRFPEVVVGQIEYVVPGWSVHHMRVAEAAYVRVEEILRDEGARLAQSGGMVLGVLFIGGKTVVGNTTLCEERRKGLYQPVTGDRIVVAGELLAEEPPFLHASLRFPVVKGDVLAQPYSALRADQRSRPVDQLREGLRSRTLTRR